MFVLKALAVGCSTACSVPAVVVLVVIQDVPHVLQHHLVVHLHHVVAANRLAAHPQLLRRVVHLHYVVVVASQLVEHLLQHVAHLHHVAATHLLAVAAVASVEVAAEVCSLDCSVN